MILYKTTLLKLTKNTGLLLILALVSSCSSCSATPSPSAPKEIFGKAEVIDNLTFSANQYKTMLQEVDADKHTYKSYGCEPGMQCIPSAFEHNKIEISAPRRWTIGFFPGVLWMLLNKHEDHNVFGSDKNYSYVYDKAVSYSNLLEEQAKRADTHDLGMMIDAPIYYALQNNTLPQKTKEKYKKIATKGANNLSTLFGHKQGVMRSWLWEPQMLTHYIQDGKKVKGLAKLRSPWQYPVIVDNMMNIEYLLKHSDPKIRFMGFSHAHNTAKNHFHYEKTDTNKERPIAYHAFDYNEMKPGNWQGLGNISAWARGQGWALYGFVVAADFAQKHPQEAKAFRDYDAFAERIFKTIKHFTQDEKVPYWDYFATRSDAYDIAAYHGDDTAKFSRILNLCKDDIPQDILPYQGYGPIGFSQNILSNEAIETLRGVKSVAGEAFVQDDLIHACGTKPYYLNARAIPKDTSAASLYASALYRWASFTPNKEKAREYEAYADKIMLELTNIYRTDRKKLRSYELGFVINSATGHMPLGKEINTPIVYGDYYFIEANLNKLKLIENRK